MPVSTARISLEDPARVISRLCRHWQHKFTVSFDTQQGEILLGETRCQLLVTPTGLRVALDGPDASQQEKLQGVVADHIRRMAHDQVLHIDWNPDIL